MSWNRRPACFLASVEPAGAASLGVFEFLAALELAGIAWQQQLLTRLGQSIDEVSATLPACARGASRLLQTTRLLLGLVAAIFALHGASLALGPRLGPRTGA